MSERAAPIAIDRSVAVAASGATRERLALARVLWPAAAVLAAAAAVQIWVGTPSDVSWLITLCEKILAGNKPYVDFIEVNPPASIFLYMPATWAAKALGVWPELMVAASGFAAIIASLALCAAVLAPAGLTARLGPLGLAFATAVIALLPACAFDQREHLAVLAGLPLFAVLAAHASGATTEWVLRLLAGLGGGVMASIKPHFALMVVAMLPYLAWRLGPRELIASVELYIAALVAALYALTVFLFIPAYVDKAAPLVAAVYLPQRASWIALAANPGLIAWLVIGRYVILLGKGRLLDPLIATPALASIGALLAFLAQGKGWPYHAYPAVALIALAIVPTLEDATRTSWRARLATPKVGCAAALALAFIYFCQTPRFDSPPLQRLVASLAPHPKLLAIGGDIALGHPLTREVGGIWVGTTPCLWITDTIYYWRQQGELDAAAEARYAPYLRGDRETLINDIKANQPDAILVADKDWKRWAFTHADVAAALADYAPLGVVDEVTVYGRKPELRLNSDSDRP